jgi:hypothetical protein
VKYFFLSEGWTTGRIWEFGGLWDEFAWQRRPHLKKMPLGIVENGETLWLFQVEEAVLMVEVRPMAIAATQAIGQVVLKRLMTADQVLQHLCSVETIINAAEHNGFATVVSADNHHYEGEA